MSAILFVIAWQMGLDFISMWIVGPVLAFDFINLLSLVYKGFKNRHKKPVEVAPIPSVKDIPVFVEKHDAKNTILPQRDA